MQNVKLLKGALIAAVTIASGSIQAAQDMRADLFFHQLFLNEVQKANPNSKTADLQHLHLLADANLTQALATNSVATAILGSAQSSLTKLVQATDAATGVVSAFGTKPLNQRPLTLVIIPGAFAEFNQDQPFAEIFARPSDLRAAFHNLVIANEARDRVSLLRKYFENEPEENISKLVDLDEVLLTGEIVVGDQVVRVISFNQEYSSLESLGDSKFQATLLNRRLEKYLDLTGPQNLALIGYSRGAVVALEMLSQAQVRGQAWVNEVRGLVSLAGPIFGSALADDALYNEESPSSRLLTYLNKTVGVLELADPNLPANRREQIADRNTALWRQFAQDAIRNLTENSRTGRPWVDAYNNLKAVAGVDPEQPMAIVLKFWSDLELDHLSTSYNFDLIRFRFFLGRLLDSTRDLSTGIRQHWWSTHDLPKGVIYYGLAAAMADRDSNAIEASLFNNPLAYGKGSFDDATMMQSHLNSTRLTGTPLDDGQVLVAQAAFLPAVMKDLNPNNAGLTTKFLGVLSTHNWGVALPWANDIQGGSVNGFPHEALLKALALQIRLDIQ